MGLTEPNQLKLEHIPVRDARPIGLVVMGSHMWGNNKPDSDIDAWAFTVEPTKRILRGLGRYQDRSVFRPESEGWMTDIHVHEVGRVVPMLLAGNINFITATLSPIVTHTTVEFEDLTQIVKDNPSKAIYDSLMGMAIQNFARYAGINRKSTKDKVLAELQYTPLEERRAAKMLSFIEFGITYMDTGRAEFVKPTKFGWDTEGVDRAIKDLEASYNASTLPDAPEEKPFRDWLLDVRLADLDGGWDD